ncbi:MAG: universal stress protein [Candidatus Brocadiae bacterium]|nr:universal stress protein [Candidatus Brocadiia bacterium]
MSKRTYSTILLFAEGSDEGMKAAREAIGLATDEKAALIIASVVDTSTLRQLLTSRIFIEEEMREYEQALEKSCRKRMNYLAQLADKAGVKNRTALLRGACHSAILREQVERKADLLVMGAFRASTARRDLMAHEKQLIIDEIPCPVLLVR